MLEPLMWESHPIKAVVIKDTGVVEMPGTPTGTAASTVIFVE